MMVVLATASLFLSAVFQRRRGRGMVQVLKEHERGNCAKERDKEMSTFWKKNAMMYTLSAYTGARYGSALLHGIGVKN